MNLESMFTREGRGSRPDSNTHTNTIETFHNLKYCSNYWCGYDGDHDGWECPYHLPWDVRRDETHITEGTSVVTQHKTLADGTVVGVVWLMTNSISQAHLIIERRRLFSRLQKGNGGGHGGGRGGGARCRGNGDYRNMNNRGRRYAQGVGGGNRY